MCYRIVIVVVLRALIVDVTFMFLTQLCRAYCEVIYAHT